MKWTIPRSLALIYNVKGRGPRIVWKALKCLFTDEGLLGMAAAPLRAFVRIREGLEAPNAVIGWVPFLVGENFKLAKESGVTAFTHILLSESKGSIHVTSADAKQPPAIRFNFLTAQLDCDVTLEAMRITRHIMTAPALDGIVTGEITRGVDMDDDAELLQWVKENAETTYHPVGACKMEHDPMAVVDNQLRVHGIECLRVADASIMIGEKASRMMLADAAT